MPGLCGSEFNTDWIFSFMALSQDRCDDTPHPAVIFGGVVHACIISHSRQKQMPLCSHWPAGARKGRIAIRLVKGVRSIKIVARRSSIPERVSSFHRSRVCLCLIKAPFSCIVFL